MQFEESSGSNYTLYTGITNVEVSLFNPTLKEIQEHVNPNAQNEPEYTKDGKIYLDFYVKNQDINSKVRFILEKTLQQNKTGTKTQFINDIGQSAWGESLQWVKDNYSSWFDATTARPALNGEVLLMEFMRCWLSVGFKKECKFDDVQSLYSGNFTELKSVINQNPLDLKGKTRMVQVLAMVRTDDSGEKVKRYQQIYSRYFQPSWNTKMDNWEKHLTNAQINADYQNSLEWKKYEAPKDNGNTSTEPQNTAALPF